MTWFAKNNDGTEVCFNDRGEQYFPKRDRIAGRWFVVHKRMDEYTYDCGVILPKGAIKSIIGIDMEWKDNAINKKEAII